MPDTKISLLFWNIHQRPLTHSIVRLVQTYNSDILLLAESPFGQDGEDLLSVLNTAPRLPSEQRFSVAAPDEEKRVQIFSRLPGAKWTLSANHSRYSIWKVRCRSKQRFLLAAAHFPEIQYQQGDEQRECAIALRLDLEAAEEGWDNPASIVIGDLNATPYDAGIVGVYGLNATPSRRMAENLFREFNGRKYKYLFNPMWRFLADEAPGTYYKSNISAPVRSDWYLLDQVLMRPALLPMLDTGEESDLQILTSDGLFSLVAEDTGVPKEDFSDHLPLFFRFYLTGG